MHVLYALENSNLFKSNNESINQVYLERLDFGLMIAYFNFQELLKDCHNYKLWVKTPPPIDVGLIAIEWWFDCALQSMKICGLFLLSLVNKIPWEYKKWKYNQW